MLIYKKNEVLIGFERPSAVLTYVARFNKFHGVYENLIETIVI